RMVQFRCGGSPAVTGESRSTGTSVVTGRESAAPVGDGTGVALAESAVGELITGESVGLSGSAGKAAWAAPGTCLGVPP
ncbi:MAG: hypothetical protein VX307_02700, partial [Chloroflexota bacterium]|nr:hypothetical protein [Chloroflexota bacterium]